MALSYYPNPNWHSIQQLDSEFAFREMELQSFPDTWNHDYFFEPNDLSYPENPNSFLSNGVSYDHHSIAADFEPFHYQKRQKGYQIYAETDHFNYPVFSNEYFPNPCLLQDYPLPEIALPEFPTTPPYSAGSFECVKGGDRSLSAQSIAARQRRRRITEKTQELGKLVPGGQKMNTAEMLQSAYKYIKYLQAQVRLLGFISSSHQVINNTSYFGFLFTSRI